MPIVGPGGRKSRKFRRDDSNDPNSIVRRPPLEPRLLPPEPEVLSENEVLYNYLTEKYERNVGFLELTLSDEVSALDLSSLIQAINTLYDINLWLIKAEADDYNTPLVFSLLYPESSEALYIDNLEIGSPNFIRFAGEVKPIEKTFSIIRNYVQPSLACLAASIAIINGGPEAYQTIEDVWQEISPPPIAYTMREVTNDFFRLNQEGKISDSDRQEQIKNLEVTHRRLKEQIPKHVQDPPTFINLQKPETND